MLYPSVYEITKTPQILATSCATITLKIDRTDPVHAHINLETKPDGSVEAVASPISPNSIVVTTIGAASFPCSVTCRPQGPLHGTQTTGAALSTIRHVRSSLKRIAATSCSQALRSLTLTP